MWKVSNLPSLIAKVKLYLKHKQSNYIFTASSLIADAFWGNDTNDKTHLKALLIS